MGSMNDQEQTFDVLIIGAGLSGICSLHHFRQRFPSWRIKLLEAGSGLGGTWYWNRYPGARFDSESVSYGFSFDKNILNKWHWRETFAPQAETLKYLEFVCDELDLLKDMQFDTRIKTAQWQDNERRWQLTDSNGNRYKTRFCVSCIGFLSEPTLPALPNLDSFEGQAFHTSRWPRDIDPHRDFANKRLGVIGTGATGIQTITAMSKEPAIKSLHVFQRTASWSAPLRNSPITEQQMTQYRQDYDTIFQQCADTPTCFLHAADPRKSCDVTSEERLELWEKLYAQPGFGKWLGTFSDTYTDREANRLYSDFMAAKIRARVHDPEVADSLIPKNHGFGTRRVPLESGYFEAYNKPNVHLVDLRKTPVETVTPRGIKTQDGKEHEVDVLIFATGFNAITGAFSAIDWRGKDGRPLMGESGTENGDRAVWVDHRPQTFLGITARHMPNLFMVMGPHQPVGNAPRNIEHSVQVVADLLEYCKDHDITYAEPTQEAVDNWTEHVVECSKGALSNEIDSWMTGVNTNVKGRQERTVVRYAGPIQGYRSRCRECKMADWKGLVLD